MCNRKRGGEFLQENDTKYEVNSYSDFRTVTNNIFGTWLLEDYDYEKIKNIINDPISNNNILRQLSRQTYNQNGIVTNTIDYMVALPTLDYVLVPNGKDKQKVKKNKEIIQDVLKKIKHKELVRDALFCELIDGSVFYYMETASPIYNSEKFLSDYEVTNIVEVNSLNTNIVVKSLPTDYTQIVGTKNGSYVIAFNLQYFDNYNGEKLERKLKKYPKEIRDAYQKWNSENGKGNSWFVLNNSKTMALKIRSGRGEKWGRPLVLAALQDIFYADYFIETKRNVLADINNKIIYQTFPQGDKPGTSALSGAQQKDQHEKVKSAVLNKNNHGGLNFFSVAAGTKLNSIDTNVDILDEKNEANINNNISMSMGFASSLLSASGNTSYTAQQSNLELVTAEIMQFIEAFSSELNKCIFENIIKDSDGKVEVYYLPTTNVNKQKTIDNAKELYLKGKGSLSLWASACGIPPDVFFALLDDELDRDIENKYPVHRTSFTQSATDDTSGRPEITDPSNPNTVVSKTNNSNAQHKPSNERG